MGTPLLLFERLHDFMNSLYFSCLLSCYNLISIGICQFSLASPLIRSSVRGWLALHTTLLGPLSTINAPAKESTAKGCSRGRGRRRSRKRGRGRVEPIEDRAHVENDPMNENLPAYHEMIEEIVDIED